MTADYEAPMAEEVGTLAQLTLGTSFSSRGDSLFGIPLPGGNPANTS